MSVSKEATSEADALLAHLSSSTLTVLGAPPLPKKMFVGFNLLKIFELSIYLCGDMTTLGRFAKSRVEGGQFVGGKLNLSRLFLIQIYQ